MLFTYYVFYYQFKLKEDKMTGELNIKSQKIIFTIQCSIKSDANEFRKWAKDRAAKYVFNLKEEKTFKEI